MFSTMRVWGVLCFGFSALTSVVGAGADPSDSAEALVRQALAAEISGDAALRHKLLGTAVATYSEYAPARWHSGMVRVDGAWLTVEAAEHQTAEQGLVFEYRRLRDRYAGTVAGQEALARWCRKKQWTDLEKMHWTNVLLVNPNHRDARSRLGVRQYGQRLLTKEQIDQYKAGQKAYERAVAAWKPRLTALAEAVASDDPADRLRGQSELRDIQTPEALPAIEQALPEADDAWAVELVRAIGNIKGQQAVEALVSCAVCAPQQAVREAAAAELKERSLYSYVPALLGAFEAPIELSYFVKTFADTVHYGYEASQETPNATYIESRKHYETRSLTIFYPNRGLFSPNGGPTGIVQRVDLNGQLASSLRRGTRGIVETRKVVAERNQRAEAGNERIAAVLTTTTGQQLGDEPQPWWQWWAEYNQLQLAKQTIRDDRVESVLQRKFFTNYSCFLRGTQVWTDTGPIPIEDVRVGDRVLSQNQETGELAYKHVLDTTIRPPSPSMRLGVGDEEIVATLGHPLWVAGKGWRMAKELQEADLLHGVHGAVPLEFIKPGPEAEAYNLVVADFHNYFIGQDRILVHDNHMRRVTEATLPGFVPAEE